MTINIYLSIGSNLGDRRSFIRRAIDALSVFGEVRVSEEYANAAEGFVSADEFINVAAVLSIESDTALTENDARAYLAKFKEIEKAISPIPHRNADDTYRDREIDIDIIAIDGLRVTSDTLTLPHPRAASRKFVTVPLAQLVGADKTRKLVS